MRLTGAGFSFVDGYRALSILSWVANIALAEAWLAWSARGRRRPTAAANMSPLQPE